MPSSPPQLPSIVPEHPFGTVPLAERETYLALHTEAKARSHPAMDALERRLEAAVDRDWLDELALHTQIVIKPNRLNYQHGRVVYAALANYLATVRPAPPVLLFETGTARGFSALCMAKALADADMPGIVFTVDRLPHDRAIIWNCIDDHDGPKSRRELLAAYGGLLDRVVFLQARTGDAVQQLGLNRIHFAFLDAEHSQEAVEREFAFVAARQRPGDRVVLDDVTPGAFPGVVAAVDAIEAAGAYIVERVASADERGYALATRT